MARDHENNDFDLTPETETESVQPIQVDDDSDTESQDDTSMENLAEEISKLDLLRHERDALEQAANERLELAQRTQAEMDNLRKRTLRDVENAHKYALEKFIIDLLPVIDSLELGIQASESAADITSLREGMNLTLKKFSDSLAKFGAVVVNPEGEKFNPEKHEAVSMTEAQGVDPGTVIAVLQKGYELNGRLVRPAMVIVSN